MPPKGALPRRRLEIEFDPGDVLSASVTSGGRIRRRDRANDPACRGPLLDRHAEHRRFGQAEANPNKGGLGPRRLRKGIAIQSATIARL